MFQDQAYTMSLDVHMTRRNKTSHSLIFLQSSTPQQLLSRVDSPYGAFKLFLGSTNRRLSANLLHF